MNVQFTIKLFGAFDVVDKNGNSCSPSSKKGCALIGLLASASNYKRSRASLMAMLWGEVPDQQAAASLRNCLYDLRTHFTKSNCPIHSDRNNVWLDSNTKVPNSVGQFKEEFLEGIDIDEEGFEDWLRENRSSKEAHAHIPNNHIVESKTLSQNFSQPHILILPVNSNSDEGQLLGDTITDVIVRTILQNQCVDVLDLREGLDTEVQASIKLPNIGLVVRLVHAKDKYIISALLKQMKDGKVIWTGWFSENMSRCLSGDEDQLRDFASKVANEVHEKTIDTIKSYNEINIFGAIHNVLSHSRSGQEHARQLLRDLVDDSAVARAWLIYTFAVAHAEQHGGLHAEALEELKEHCVLADDKSPNNPIVQAIIGHIYAFVFRLLDQAESHHSHARKLGWSHPLVWTLSAMHKIYACQPDKAYEYSKRAMVLSSNSPYHFFFQGPHSISCSLTGRHSEAIVLSKKILAKKPVFLAAMRHLAASQVLIGETSDARDTVSRIRSKDPRFQVGEISSDDYPLPSAKSVEFIEHALTLGEMAKPSISV